MKKIFKSKKIKESDFIMAILTSKKQKAAVIIDDVDVKNVGLYNWTKDKSNNYFYRQYIVNKTQNKIYLHHEIAELKFGRRILDGECVDHVNGDKSDNRRDNLRIVTYKQNRINNNPLSSRTNTCFTGITKKNDLYVVTVNKKQIGKFITIEKAINAKCDFIEAIYKIDVRERWKVAAKSQGIEI